MKGRNDQGYGPLGPIIVVILAIFIGLSLACLGQDRKKALQESKPVVQSKCECTQRSQHELIN